MTTRPRVFAYYFPNFHRDPSNEERYGKGWNEWALVTRAQPRFPGHKQPRVPALGYFDEADPAVMAQQIDLAVEHGVDGFIFDWYWYDGATFLGGALERGFLQAENRALMEFSLMWANHDWLELFPSPDPDVQPDLVYRGSVTRAQFDAMAAYVVDTYFQQPNYTLIEGRPRFSIYEIGTLISAFGSIEGARDALDHFDSLARSAGFPGIHLDIVVWSFAVLPSDSTITDPASIIEALGARSASSYVWVHHVDPPKDYPFPASDQWGDVGRRAFEQYEGYAAELPVPFHPNVSCGWDPSPRCSAASDFSLGHYPWIPTFAPSLAAFTDGLRRAKAFVEAHPGSHSEVTINAWNEWTEGSYLLPDEQSGFGFLEAVREVFPPEAEARGAGEVPVVFGRV